jgi:hypothetical protein
LELAGNSQLALERNSALLSEEGESGSSSLPFDLLKTPTNDRELGYPNRFDQRAGQAPQLVQVEALDDVGNGITKGNLRFRGVSPTAYQYNLEFGDSAVMARLKAKRMQEFRFGGARYIMDTSVAPPNGPFDAQVIADFMMKVVENNEDYDFTFAPFSNNDSLGTWEAYVQGMEDFANRQNIKFTPQRNANFNTWSLFFNGSLGGSTPGKMGFAYSAGITIPGGIDLGLPSLPNCLPCPLPKLEYIVRTMFDELGLPLETDVFDTPDMKRVVIVPVAGVTGWAPRPGGAPQFDYVSTIHLSQHMPDLNAAEFIRRLMNTFGWHFDVTPIGTCRLLKAAPLVLTGEPVDITSLVGPAFTVELSEPKSIIGLPNWPANDAYAAEFSEQPDPATIQGPVASRVGLPPAATAGMHRLVQDERRYYVTEAETVATAADTSTTVIKWKPASFYAPGQQVGTSDNTEDYTLGINAVLTTRVPIGTGTGDVLLDLLCFSEPSFVITQAELTAAQTSQAGALVVGSVATRSQNLRLGLYYGLQTIPGALDFNGDPALIPWLSQRNLAPDGTVLGELTLEAHGPNGLVARCLTPTLALRQAETLVKFPAYFDAYQFTRLDFSRMVSIRGDQFMARRLSLSFPVKQAGQLELVPRRQVELVKSRPVVSDGFFTDTAEVQACNLVIVQVERAGDVATVLVDKTVGELLYQLDAGTVQKSNVFTGLKAGQSYTFWVYDLGVTGCHKKAEVIW